MEPNAPDPISVSVKHRILFSEVDPMGIVWHGNYAALFERAAAELGRQCGLSYRDYMEADLRAPVVQFHVDHFKPLFLDEEASISAAMIWNPGARMDTEYHIRNSKQEITTTGYTVQVFTEAKNNEPYFISPSLWEKCKSRWLSNELAWLQ